MTLPAEPRATCRSRVHRIIEVGRGQDRASFLFDAVIVALILLNVAAFVTETVPEIHAQWGWWLRLFEVFSVAVFTLEYLARLWTAVEIPFLARLGPVGARLELARSPALIIDLLAILPSYLMLLAALGFGAFGIDLRVLRVLRLLSFFKLSRYSPAVHTLLRVLRAEGRSLLAAGLLLSASLLIASTGMYYIEGHAQPDKFGSVPAAMYWAMTTLTTVGYGDVYPITPLGKLWAMLTMLIGLCILALPVAIIATGFAQEVSRRDFVVTWSMMAQIPIFADLDQAHVEALIPLLHAQSIPARHELIRAGAAGESMYFLTSGRVQLKEPAREHVYRTGDVFGIVAVLDRDFHRGTFTTITRVRILMLHRDDYLRLELTNPAIAERIRLIAAERRAARDAARQGRSAKSATGDSPTPTPGDIKKG